MALNLDKLVEDAKRSGSAKDAIVFVIQNIGMLINDAAGDPGRGEELFKELNSRAPDFANSIIDNRDVQPVAPHENAHERSVHRTNPVGPTMQSARSGRTQADVPKPRLEPANPGAYQPTARAQAGIDAVHPHENTEQSQPRTNPTGPAKTPEGRAEAEKEAGKATQAERHAVKSGSHAANHGKKR